MATINEESSTASSCSSRCCDVVRRCLPRALLILGYVLYLLLGGVVFSLIEEPQYKQLLQEHNDMMMSAQEKIVEEAYRNASRATDPDRIPELIESLTNIAHSGVKEGPRNMTVELGNEWSIGNAMLFCMTTITTIGYGHVIPHTLAGKVICVFYTWIGIPLSVLLLGDIGRLSAIAFMKTFNRCLGRVCKSRRTRGLERQNSIRRKPLDDCVPQNEGDGEAGEGNSAGTELVDPELELTDASASRGEEGAGAGPSIYIGGNRKDDKEQYNYARHRASTGSTIVNNDDGDDGVLDDVPVVIAPIVFWSYLFACAPIFACVEGWDYKTSVYFLFFSVTTVGFGDLVPETSLGLVFSWFGLVVVAMCIALSYRRVICMAKWVLGFLHSNLNKKKSVHYSHI